MDAHITREMYDNYYTYMGKKFIAGKDRVSIKSYRYSENYDIILRKINNMTYKFTDFKQIPKNNRIVYIPTIRDRIVLEHIKNCIVQKYKLEIKSREQIISELKILCEENINYFIIRTDISSFFANINQEILLNKLLKSSLMNVTQIYLIEQLLAKMPEGGIPQGIGISNYLSELYLENFDLEIKAISPRVFYYSRYVDDIILIIPGKVTTIEKEALKTKLEKLFEDYDLTLNKKKTMYLDFNKEDSDVFNYLGYSFRRINSELVMDIANYKIIKLKDHIDKIFNLYDLTANYNLLFEQLKIFSSVNQINKLKGYFTRKGDIFFRRRCIKYGINVDYKYACNQSIDKINKYIKYKITCLTTLSRQEKLNLYSYLVRYNNEKHRLIVYEKINILDLRRMLHNIAPFLSWRQILVMKKQELLSEYYRITKIE